MATCIKLFSINDFRRKRIPSFNSGQMELIAYNTKNKMGNKIDKICFCINSNNITSAKEEEQVIQFI